MIFNGIAVAPALLASIDEESGIWLLRATWNAAADQNYTDAQVLDTNTEGVEDGSLTVVETDGTLSVIGNKLAFTPQASEVWGDQGVFSNSVSRVVGLGLLSRVEVRLADTDIMPAVFGDAGDVGLTNQIYCHWLETNRTGRILVKDGAGGGLEDARTVHYFPYTDYEYLIVLGGFSTTQTVWESGSTSGYEYGAHFFVKNLLGEWCRTYATHHQNTATLYASVSNYLQSGRLDSIRIPDTTNIDFTSVLSPSAYLAGARSPDDTFTHPAHFFMKFVFTYDTTYGIIEFRKTDASNRYFIDMTGGRFRLFHTIAGANTQLVDTSGVFSNGLTYSIAVLVRGRHVRAWVNGVIKITYDSAVRFTAVTNGNIGDTSGGLRDLAVWEHFPSGDDKALLDSATDLTQPGTQIDINAYVIQRQNTMAYQYDAITTIDISATKYQAAGWWESARNLVLAKRTLPSGSWTIYRYNGVDATTIGPVTDDNHNVVSLGVDPDGYLHICYNMHTDALLYRRSDAPLNSWTGGLTTTLSMLGTNEADVTYPTFVTDPAGTLYFIFRDGDSNNADVYFYVYDEGTETWAAAAGTGTAGLLIDGAASTDAIYWNGPPAFDADWGSGGMMHLSFHWRTAGGVNEDVSYVKWNGTNWLTADGSAQTVPITKANCEIIDETTTTVGLTSFNGIAADDDGNPHIVYPKNNGSGFVQIYHIWHNGTSWQGPTAITNQAVLASTTDDGLAPQNVTAACDQSNGKVFVIYNGRAYNEGNGLYAYTSTNYTDWVKETISETEIGCWRPSFDRNRWREDGIFNFLHVLFDVRLIEWTP